YMIKSKDEIKLSGNLDLVIGDSLYYDSHPDLVLNKHFKNVDIQVNLSEEYDGHVPVAKIIISPKGEESIFSFEDDKIYFPKNRKVRRLDLGCDTASYEFNGYPVHTMADGIYGMALYQKVGRHAFIEIDGGYMAELYETFKQHIIIV